MLKRPRRRMAIRVAGTALGVALVARLLLEADLPLAWATVRALGPKLPIALVPFVVGMAFDTMAWRRILQALSAPARFTTLLRIRLATEAFVLTLPGGVLLAEVWKPILLRRVLSVNVARGAASVAAKKALYLIADGAYLALGVAGGHAMLSGLAQALGAEPDLARALPLIVGGAALALTAFGVLLSSALGGGRLAQRALGFLRRITPRRFAPKLDRFERGFVQVDDAARSVFAHGPRGVASPLLLLFLQWLMEASETYAMLRLLGVDAGFLPVLAFEALNSLLKSAAFVLPAGLGVQETGQLYFLRSIGVVDAVNVAAALLLLKRGKDLFWGATGYGLLASLRAPKAAA